MPNNKQKIPKQASATAVRVAIITAIASLAVSLLNFGAAHSANREARATALAIKKMEHSSAMEIAEAQQRWKQLESARAQDQQTSQKFREMVMLRIDKRTAELESGLRAIQGMKDAIQQISNNPTITLGEAILLLERASSTVVETYGNAIGPLNHAYHTAKNVSISVCGWIRKDIDNSSASARLDEKALQSLKIAHEQLSKSWSALSEQCEQQRDTVLRHLREGTVTEPVRSM